MRQLKEKDVRHGEAVLDPASFLDAYVASNFAQTAAHPSLEQKKLGIIHQLDGKDVNLYKKPGSGTSFDRPQGY